MTSTTFRDADYCSGFMPKLMKLQEDTIFTDINLNIEGTIIPCHKVVLCIASPYFHAMFSSGLRECNSSEVEIKDVDAATALLLVKYIYRGEIEIDANNVQNLLQAAELLQFASLKGACEGFMLDHVEPENCLAFHKLAKMFHLDELAKYARGCMCTRFKYVVKSSDFLQLTLPEIIDYVSDDRLILGNEDVVFEAAVAWANANLEERKPLFIKVLEHIKLPLCSENFLCQVVRYEPLMTDAACQSLLVEALCYCLLPEHPVLSTRFAKRASCRQKIVVMGGQRKYGNLNTSCWYLENGSWLRLTGVPKENIYGYNVCAVDQGILVTGGIDETITSNCWLFNMEDRTWESLPAMRQARFRHQSLCHNGGAYVFGGLDDRHTALDSVEKYNFQRKLWLKVTQMPKPLCDPLAISFGESLFVMGGRDERRIPSCDVQEYCLNGKWNERAHMPVPCGCGSIASLGDKIYVVSSDMKVAMCFQPSTEVWWMLPSPADKHSEAPVLAWEGKILLGGGTVEAQRSSQVEAYDPPTRKWSQWDMTLKEELASHFMLSVDFGSGW